MFNSLNMLKETLQHERIEKNIDIAVNSPEGENDVFLAPKKQFKKIEDVLKDIQNFKIKKTYRDDAKKTNAIVRRDYEIYLEKLSGLKGSLFQEIDK